MKKINFGSKAKLALQIILPILIAFISYYAIANWASSSDTHRDAIASLDEKQETVMKLSATSLVASTAIAAIPGDASTPIANQIAELSEYFIIILSVIFLEKYLVTVTGVIAFRYLIPIACVMFAIGAISKNIPIRELSVKIAIFALAIFALIPFSEVVSNEIYNTYKDRIEETMIIAEETAEVINNSTEKEKEGIAKWLDNIKTGIINIKESVVDTAENIEKQLSGFIESAAVMLVMCCVVPLLSVIAFMWIMKIIFGINIVVPKKKRVIVYKRKAQKGVTQNS